MSHFSNDLIADRAISDAVDLVDSMSDNKVKQVLFLNFDIKVDAIDDVVRDVLINKISEQFFAEAMEAPGPMG